MTSIKTNTLRALSLSLFAFVFALVALPNIALGQTNTLTIPVEQIFNLEYRVERASTFSYELRALDATYPLPQGAQGSVYNFTLTGSEAQQLGPITFVRAGVYSYEIRSTQESAHNLELDQRVYTVVIGVRNIAAGQLQATIDAIYVQEGQNHPIKLPTPDIIFAKYYLGTLEIPQTLPIPVVKTVQGNPASDYTFTFRLEAYTDDQPMPQGSSGRTVDITITGSGRAYFGSWTHTQTGTFIYTVREIATDNSDYVFDTSVYTITDTVTRTGNTFSVERIVTTEESRQVTSMSFINTYVGTDIEIQEQDPPPPGTPGAGGTTNRPILGPKTGDYADPVGLLLAMMVSAIVTLFTLALIYLDRRSEEDSVDVAVIVASRE